MTKGPSSHEWYWRSSGFLNRNMIQVEAEWKGSVPFDSFKYESWPSQHVMITVSRCTDKMTSRRSWHLWNPSLAARICRSTQMPSSKMAPLTAIPVLLACAVRTNAIWPTSRCWGCCHLWVHWNMLLAPASAATFIPRVGVRTARAAPFATCRTTGARPVVLNARRGWPTPRHHPRMKKSSWDSQRCHQCHPCCPSAKRWCLPQASRAYWPHSQWLLCGRMKIWSCQFHPLWVPPSWILFPWHQRGAWPLCQWQIQPLGGTICPELSTVEVCFLDHNIEDFVEIQPLSTFVLASILGPRWHLLLAPWPCCCRAIWRWVNTFGKIIPSRPLI